MLIPPQTTTDSEIRGVPIQSAVLAIVVDFQGAENTKQCLDSLSRSSQPVDILLVNNAGPDESLRTLSDNYPECRIFDVGYNSGFAAANNIGIRMALKLGYKYVFLINNDAIVETNTIRTLLKVLEEYPAYGMISPVVYQWGSQHQVWFCKGDIDWRNARTYRRTDCAEIRDPGLTVWESEFLSGCALLARVDVIRQIGLLDEMMFLYREDSDWCVRCQRAGFRCGVTRAGRVWHKGYGSSGGQESDVALFYAARNQVRFYSKHGSPFLLPRFWFLYLRDHFQLCHRLYSNGQLDLATAVAHGVWAGMTQQVGDGHDRRPAPSWCVRLLLFALAFLRRR